MNKQEYIEWLAPRVVIDSIRRNLLPSVRIAQGCFEPAYGTSELAVNANNLFGVKNNDQWQGKCYNKETKECYDGVKLEDINADFRAYGSWEESIADQGDFLLNRCTTPKYHPELKHYAELIGNRDYRDCARILQEKHYGTAPDYAQRVVDYVEKHDLTQYDSMTMEEAQRLVGKESEEKKMIINVHAGHNPDGKTACGAIGLIKESTEARKVKDEVVRQLRALGHTVYDCTVDNGTSQLDVLKKIVAKCNAHAADLDVSIHFNSGAGDKSGNGKTTGTEVLVYRLGNAAEAYARETVEEISELGFRNRGVKVNSGLYVLKNTKAPAMLIECCFVDDADDVKLYNTLTMASAIVKGITGQMAENTGNEPDAKPQAPSGVSKLYRVQCGAFSVKKNAEAMLKKVKAAGFSAFVTYEDGLYKVQVGAFSLKSNAEAMLKKVTKAGVTAVIV